MTIIEKIAHAFSILLHPMLMSVYGVCLLFVYTGMFANFSIFFQIMLPIIILTCIFPMNGIFLLKRFRLIKDYDTDRKDRFLPFLILFLCHVLLLYYFAQPNIPLWFLTILAIPLVLLLLTGVINIFWKISAHMIGIGGLIGSTLSIAYYVKSINPYALFIILFILAGCLGTSRLILRRHTPAQVYAGFALGLIVSFFCIWFNTYFIIFRFL